MTFLTLAAGAGPSALVVDLVVILTAAGLVSVVASLFRLASVPAYLITGALIGPGVLGLVSGHGQIEELGSLAIVLMMFGIGLHLDMSVLHGRVRRMLGIAAGSIVLSVAPIWLATYLLGMTAPQGLTVALAFSLSSTALVLRVLQERRQMKRMTGQLSLAILIVQDIGVVAILVALPAIAKWGGAGGHSEPGWSDELIAVAKGAGGIAAILVAGKVLLPPVLRIAARSSSGETLMVISVAFAIGAGALTSELGLSPELGAFLGGFLLATTPFRHHLSGQIGTVRDLFIAVFFTILGMAIDPVVIAENWITVALWSVGIIALKTSVISGVCVLFGTTLGVALQVGMGLSQVGEFGLVILSVAAGPELGLVDPEWGSTIRAVVVVSLIFTPALMSLGERLSQPTALTRTAPWVASDALVDADERATAQPDADHRRPHVVVAGFGVVGRAVVDRLGVTGATVTIVEMNLRTVQKQRQMGKSIVYGDISDPEVLESAGIGHAAALAVTIPDQDATLRACRVAKKLNPDVYIIARTNYLSRALQAMNLGANEAVVEEMATAEAMDKIVERVIGEEEK